jgi:hypothetical protein
MELPAGGKGRTTDEVLEQPFTLRHSPYSNQQPQIPARSLADQVRDEIKGWMQWMRCDEMRLRPGVDLNESREWVLRLDLGGDLEELAAYGGNCMSSPEVEVQLI